MRCFSRLWLVAALGLLLTWAALVPAQVRPGDADKLGSKADVDEFNGNNRRLDFDNYMKGIRTPSGDEAKKVFELAARVYVFRLTWFDSIQRSPELMDKTRGDFKRVIGFATLPDSVKNNQDAVKLWSPMLVAVFKQVLDLPIEKNRLSCLNAAILLPDLAKLKHPEIADLLVTLLEDPKKHDAIKIWAAQGLTEFFPAVEFDVVQKKGDKAAEQRKETELKRVNALLKFVTRQWSPDKDTPPREVDAFRYVRRMALKALADARVPAIVADPKGQKLEGAVAPVFLAILEKGRYSPEPTLAERIEAAIGICRIQVSATSAYQPNEGIYRVGTLLVEVADRYKNDYNQFGGKGAQVKSVPILPWKHHAKRLQVALAELGDSVKGDVLRTDAAENVRKLSNPALQLLGAMQRHEANFSAKDLADVVNTLRPKSAEVFKGLSAAAAPSGE